VRCAVAIAMTETSKNRIMINGPKDTRVGNLLPFGHTPTENSCQGSLGEKSQTELDARAASF
jgi:hypothetical protein